MLLWFRIVDFGCLGVCFCEVIKVGKSCFVHHSQCICALSLCFNRYEL
jgi:hypothetical protein